MNAHTVRMRRAFSLLELMVVIVVIAVLAAVVVPRFVDHARRGREAGLRHNLAQLRTAAATFQADTGYYPKALVDLASTSPPAQAYDSTGTLRSVPPGDWHGPYIGSLPVDPISGTPFTYTVSAPGVGTVTSSAAGNDLTGVPFSAY